MKSSTAILVSGIVFVVLLIGLVAYLEKAVEALEEEIHGERLRQRVKDCLHNTEKDRACKCLGVCGEGEVIIEGLVRLRLSNDDFADRVEYIIPGHETTIGTQKPAWVMVRQCMCLGEDCRNCEGVK